MAYSSFRMMAPQEFARVVGHGNRSLAESTVLAEKHFDDIQPNPTSSAQADSNKSQFVPATPTTDSPTVHPVFAHTRTEAIETLKLIDDRDPLQSEQALDPHRNQLLCRIFSENTKDGGLFVRTFVGGQQRFEFSTPDVNVAGITYGKEFPLSQENEDCLAIAQCADGARLYVVGDGVGGSFAGEVASEIITTVTAQCIAEGSSFSESISAACKILRSCRPQLAAAQMVDILLDIPPKSMDDFESWFVNEFQEYTSDDGSEIFFLNSARLNSIKFIFKDYLTSLQLKQFTSTNISTKVDQLYNALFAEFSAYSGDYFFNEPSTTLALCLSWTENGKQYRRLISIGDGSAMLFKQTDQDPIELKYRAKPHSLTTIMQSQNVFENGLRAIGVREDEITLQAELAYMSHPKSNIILAHITHSGIHMADRQDYRLKVEDSGDIELDDNATYIALLATDRMRGSLTESEIATILSQSSSAAEAMTMLYIEIERTFARLKRVQKTLKNGNPYPSHFIGIPETTFQHHNIRSFLNVPGGSDDTTLVVEYTPRKR